jgi:type I restriction enzyme, S subunit
MRSRWISKCVGDLQAEGALRVEDGNHGEYRPRRNEFSVEGTSFIRAADVVNGTVDFEGADRITDKALGRIRKGVGRPNDIIVTHKGTVGRVGRVPHDAPPFVCSPQTTYWRVLDESKIDRDYLFAYLRSPAFAQQLYTRMHGSDMAPYVSLTEQKTLSLDLPPLDQQRAIGGTLCSLDDKIEINNRVAATLENIAAALFKARFIDFVGHEDLVESAIGPVPEGWQVDRLGNHVKALLGGTPSRKRSEYWTDGAVPWINSGKVNDFRILEPTAFITNEALEQSSAKMMPAGTTVLAITGATLGQVSRLEIESSANQSVVGVLGNEWLPDDYLFFGIRHRMTDLLARQTGAAQQHINKGDVNDLLILLPPANVLREFCRASEPLLQRIATALLEGRTLELIRDALLPRLISGDSPPREEPASGTA